MIPAASALAKSSRTRGALLLGAALMLGACTHTSQEVTGSVVPNDYRQRHPIVIQEADRNVDVFVGSGRGGLSETQRQEVAGLGQTWLREGTGAITVYVPANTPNARAATDAAREIRSILGGAGIPARGVNVTSYQPDNPRLFAPIRLTYARIAADAGPCGVWPDDLGPSIKDKGYYDNKPYWNMGCATQRNLAAMVANPADLVQPRNETPVYTARRTVSFDKYRKGNTTATTYPESDKAKLSELGK